MSKSKNYNNNNNFLMFCSKKEKNRMNLEQHEGEEVWFLGGLG